MNLTRPRLALVGVLTLLALTGCSGGGGASTTSADGSVAADSVPAPAAPAGKAIGDTGHVAALGDSGGSTPDVQQKAVIRNGTVVVRTPDPQRARHRVNRLLKLLHGSIDAEQTVYDQQGHIHDSHLVLRVPVASFTKAMHRVEGLGTVVDSSSTGRDVSTEVIDIQQRLETLRISLHDLNSFQRQASDIGQLLRFESAITQRRGEFQSLKAQRNHLRSQTSMSTIDLDISVPPVHTTTVTSHRHAGFLTGLRHGWSALTGTVVVGLTAVGALLPFAVVLAAIGLPLWWWIRRTARNRPAVQAASEGPAAD